MELNLDLFKITHNNIAPKQGKILISEPFSQDAYFKRSVVLLTEHNELGSIGFILNNPIQMDISEVISDIDNFDTKVSIGGPVNTDSIYFIHTLGEAIPNSNHVFDNIYWGGDFEILKILIQSNAVTKEQVRFFIGYSGWSPQQLDGEIGKDFWLVSDLKSDEIMNNDKNIWKITLQKLGEKYRLWTNFPENPNLN